MKIWGIIGLIVIGIGGAACTTDDAKDGAGGTAGTGNGGSGNGGSGGTAGNTTGGTAGNTTGGTAGNTTGGTAGNTTGGTAGNTTGGSGGGTSCADEATFAECGQCFCTANQPGCGAFNTAQEQNLFCGETCGTGDCATFCADTSKDPDTTCFTCANGITQGSTDANAFVAACQADSDCVAFLTDLQTCPQN